jgi:hypothetical protein
MHKTDNGFRAVIPTQREPSANSENDSEPRAINEPGATAEPRAMNSNSNAKRIDPKRDL